MLGTEVGYVALLFVLIVVPRLLAPLRLPPAITALGLGALATLGAGLFAGDATVKLLATFGIVSLFLLAGLEVEFHELRRGARVLVVHALLRLALYAGTAWVVSRALGLAARPATIAALALMTPSTGFILDSLGSFGLSEDERFWVKSKAIVSEMVALLALFAVMQSESAARLANATIALVGMIAALPVVFWLFQKTIAPRARNAEFAFLLLVAVICALGTKQLGVYYLVGAFVTGLAARMVQRRLPAMSSPQLVHALLLFASFFVPIYFFRAGTGLSRDDFTADALVLGAIFFVTALPARILLTLAGRRLLVREPVSTSLRIAVPLLPTLVFTLVLAGILRDEFGASPTLYGALVVYTLANTILPGLLIGRATPVTDSEAA